MRIIYGSRFVTLRGRPRPAKRNAVSAMWVGVLMSSVVLAEMHWAAAVATIGLGAIGTLTIVSGIRTVTRASTGMTVLRD